MLVRIFPETDQPACSRAPSSGCFLGAPHPKTSFGPESKKPLLFLRINRDNLDRFWGGECANPLLKLNHGPIVVICLGRERAAQLGAGNGAQRAKVRLGQFGPRGPNWEYAVDWVAALPPAAVELPIGGEPENGFGAVIHPILVR